MRSLVLILVLFSGLDLAQAVTHHQVRVAVDPSAHRLTVADQITLPPQESKLGRDCRREFSFGLHSGLAPRASAPAELILRGRETIDRDHQLEIERYSLRIPCGVRTVAIEYAGEIFHPITDIANPYSRGTADTPGIISDEGIVLSAATFWFPVFEGLDDRLVSFALEGQAPQGWTLVSQGEEIAAGVWQEMHPQDDFYLIAARFTRYERSSASGVKLQAFLRTPDDQLADKYLSVTSGYIDRYSRLIAPYPYSKFALVENFWDTGFGMPSFTLLGSNIIRLPFIISTSYPHEILHDWWGNSVFVDSKRGNWCEGITAYMADHLMAELSNAGDGFRRDLLQKYTDFVTDQNDFPLTEFINRTDAPTEAVGYGKALMFFHMLRIELGDDLFKRAFARFYRDNMFKQVSFGEIRAAFEATSGRDLKAPFQQWVTRKGAPTLSLSNVKAQPVAGEYQLRARIEQRQDGGEFVLNVPVAIHLEGESQAAQKIYTMTGRALEISEVFSHRPVWIEVDPEWDVFRRLARDEVPPALTMALGAQRTLMILPASAPAEIINGWREFATILAVALPKGPHGEVILEVRTDTELQNLPDDRAIWVLGAENSFSSRFQTLLSDQPVRLSQDSVEIDGRIFNYADHSLTLTARPKQRAEQVWIFASTRAPGTFATLAQKLVHYGKYSYLAFSGDSLLNVAKGVWKLTSSSMSIPISQVDGAPVNAKKGSLAPRSPLSN